MPDVVARWLTAIEKGPAVTADLVGKSGTGKPIRIAAPS
jgi:hypothetical protein